MAEGKRDQVGQQLGNYRLLRLLGRGGFAEVYLGEHVYLKSHAAVKLLHTMLKDEERAVFLQEAQTLVRLSHPHIVRVLDFAIEDGTPFLVMEYAPNGTLRQRHPKGTVLSPETILPYVQQVASALQYAHDQWLIHRDVKPENMLLGARDEVLLSDFGLAMLAPQTHPYSTHEMARQVAGTSLYLAPEQLQGHPGPASDQYALGVVVYEWLCGRPPFGGTPIEVAAQHLSMAPPPLREQVPDLSPALEEVVLRALEKEPQQRFARVQDFADALEQACQLTPLHRVSPASIVEAPAPVTASQVLQSTRKPEPLWKVPTVFRPLIGREQEVAAVVALLLRPEVRLVTLLGTGGIGKTSLALQVATEMRAHFADGCCVVPLAPVTDPALVVPTIAEVLGIREIGKESLLEQMKLALRDRHLLLVLDNFEQLLATAPLTEELLLACPSLNIVVTSRAVLHVQMEQEFPVSPLALPDLRHLPESEELLQYAAVSLFVQRVRAILPTFQVTAANARAIAEICVRLDGLPLAIELAAARIKLLPPLALLARLSQRLQVLTGGARTLPARQQTLRNTLKWSYDLLDAGEQRLFRRLAVFVGGWTLEAVEAVVNVEHDTGDGGLSILDEVASLLDKSLLLQVEQEGGEPRLQMLMTVREYGLECLRERGEAEAAQRAHALYYLQLAEEAERHLKGTQQLVWLRRLEQELENLRAALEWLVGHEEVELAFRLCGALWRFWEMRGYWSEGRRWLEAALGLPNAQGRTAARAKALFGVGYFASSLGDVGAARALLEESVALYRELEDKRSLAEALSELGWCMFQQNDFAAAHTLLEEGVVLARSAGDRWTLAYALRSLGWFMRYQDDLEAARLPLEESVTLCRELGDKHALSRTLSYLTEVTLSQGNVTQAVAMAQESLALAREQGNKPDIVQALYRLAIVTSYQKDGYAQAAALVQEVLVLAREMGDKERIARALFSLGECALYQSDLPQAAALVQDSLILLRELGTKSLITVALNILGNIRLDQGDLVQAKALYTEGLTLAKEAGRNIYIGWHLIGLAQVAATEGQLVRAARLYGAASPWLNPDVEVDPTQRPRYESFVEQVRAQLGEEAFAARWEQGKAMTPEKALAAPEHDTVPAPPTMQQQLGGAKPPATQTQTYPDDLTAREVEILRLVAQGWTDGQIAEQLVISPRTVNAHLTSIYRKIGVSSRSAATRYAMEKQLV